MQYIRIKRAGPGGGQLPVGGQGQPGMTVSADFTLRGVNPRDAQDSARGQKAIGRKAT